MIEPDYTGWVQIELNDGLNVTLQPCHYSSKTEFMLAIKSTLTNVYNKLGWNFSKEEIENQTIYYSIRYKDLYSANAR